MVATKHLFHASVALAALAASAACTRGSVVPHTWQGATSTAPTATLPVGGSKVVADERLSFRVSALGFAAGELVMAAGRPGTARGKNAIFYHSRAETTGVVALLKNVTDRVQCWIDLDTGRPIVHRNDSTKRSKFGGAATEEGVEVEFDESPLTVAEWGPGEQERSRQILPGDATPFDMTSALMAMRGWQAEEGHWASFFVLRSTRFWQVHVQHAGRTSVKTELGRFAAIRLDGVTRRFTREGTPEIGKEPRHFSIWFTDDDLRLPVLLVARTDIGDIEMELVEYLGAGREVAAAPR